VQKNKRKKKRSRTLSKRIKIDFLVYRKDYSVRLNIRKKQNTNDRLNKNKNEFFPMRCLVSANDIHFDYIQMIEVFVFILFQLTFSIYSYLPYCNLSG
jgi:hypothetical protein